MVNLITGAALGNPMHGRNAGGGSPSLYIPPRDVPLTMWQSGASHSDAINQFVTLTAESFGSPGDVDADQAIIIGSHWQTRFVSVTSPHPQLRSEIAAGTVDVLSICNISSGVGASGTIAVDSGKDWRDLCQANGTEMFVWVLNRIDAGGVDFSVYATAADVPNSVWTTLARNQRAIDPHL